MKELNEAREWIAKYIFHEGHPVTNIFPDYWGITDTIDDESWRRLERHCYYSADQILHHLAEKGVMIQTEKGMIALEDLLK